MSSRHNSARHRAQTVRTNPLGSVSKAVSANAGTVGRQAAVIAAASGLILTMGFRPTPRTPPPVCPPPPSPVRADCACRYCRAHGHRFLRAPCGQDHGRSEARTGPCTVHGFRNSSRRQLTEATEAGAAERSSRTPFPPQQLRAWQQSPTPASAALTSGAAPLPTAGTAPASPSGFTPRPASAFPASTPGRRCGPPPLRPRATW